MNDRQENKVSMYLAVLSVCDLYNPDWAGSVGFANAVGRFRDKLLELNNTVEVQETPRTGIHKDKMNVWEAMKDEALLVSGAVTAYATTINNQRLKDAVHFTATDLMRVRDTLAGQRALIIHDQANAVVANLADFGVTPATLTSLNGRILEFNKLMVAPRVAIVDRKGATSQLKNQMKELDMILKDEMDPLMAAYRNTALGFYDAYFNARKIVDTGSSKPSVVIRVMVSEAESGVALKDVDVAAVIEGDTRLYVGIPLPNGGWKLGFSASAIGDLANVSVTASKDGYKPAKKVLAVLPKTEYDLEMELKPSTVESEDL